MGVLLAIVPMLSYTPQDPGLKVGDFVLLPSERTSLTNSQIPLRLRSVECELA